MEPLSRELLLAALDDLAERLRVRNTHARLYIAGGAAMILAHDAQRATRDIDSAIAEGYEAVLDAVREIARERGWPSTWLNEQATAYMPSVEHRQGVAVFEHPYLTVVAATARHMLAMKARAARRADAEDVRRLAAATGIADVDGVSDVVNAVFPGEELGDRQRLWLSEVLPTASAERPGCGKSSEDS